jgi:hypothetical protein
VMDCMAIPALRLRRHREAEHRHWAVGNPETIHILQLTSLAKSKAALLREDLECLLQAWLHVDGIVNQSRWTSASRLRLRRMLGLLRLVFLLAFLLLFLLQLFLFLSVFLLLLFGLLLMLMFQLLFLSLIRLLLSPCVFPLLLLL